MSKGLVRLSDVEGVGTLTPVGFQPSRKLTYEEWEECGRTLQQAAGAVQWWIGDWLNYGEREYGEKYAQAVEVGAMLDRNVETVRAAQWVSERIPIVRRLTTLSWSHHQAVASLEPEEQGALLGEAETNGWSHRQLRDAVRHYKKALEAPPQSTETCTVDDLHALIKEGRTFGTIYADPPWPYDNQATRASTDKHYETPTLEWIAELPVSQLLADNAHLHLWTTNAFLFDARTILEAWGFAYKSCFIWTKPIMGIGNYWRVSHEFMLLGVRGSQPFLDRAQMSWREFPRGKHSAKPEPVYDIIEKVSPGPFLELFARRQRPGWLSWGDDIDRDLFYTESG